MPAETKHGHILLYHRVGDTSQDPWGLTVHPRRFRNQLEFLRAARYPTSLSAMIDVQGTTLPSASEVVVTIDDGYAETTSTVVPLLEAFDVSATLYIPSGAVGQTGEYWWDALEGLILGPGRLPPSISVSVRDRRYLWRLDGWEQWPPSDRFRFAGWRAWVGTPPTPRHQLFTDLWHLCLPLVDTEIWSVIEQLSVVADSQPAPRQDRRVVTDQELRSLAKHPLISIGAHTRTHAQLSSRTPSQQEVEIEGGRRDLQAVIGESPKHLAYPFGKRGDYGPAAAELACLSGFSSAVTNIPGTVTGATDRYHLPRIFVQDWDAAQLGAQVPGRA